MPANASRGLVILSAVMLFCSGYLIVLVNNAFLAIRKKLYGDPVYKQNVADIRDRNRRLKQGQGCSLMKISVLSSAGRQDPGRDIPEYYVDKDRNIPVTDTKDIKGNLLRRCI